MHFLFVFQLLTVVFKNCQELYHLEVHADISVRNNTHLTSWVRYPCRLTRKMFFNFYNITSYNLKIRYESTHLYVDKKNAFM